MYLSIYLSLSLSIYIYIYIHIYIYIYIPTPNTVYARAKYYKPEFSKVKFPWKMPLEVLWTIPVEIHWKSDDPLDNTTDK